MSPLVALGVTGGPRAEVARRPPTLHRVVVSGAREAGQFCDIVEKCKKTRRVAPITTTANGLPPASLVLHAEHAVPPVARRFDGHLLAPRGEQARRSVLREPRAQGLELHPRFGEALLAVEREPARVP